MRRAQPGKVSCHAVGVQIVKNDPYHLYIHQPPHLVGEVLHGTAFGDGYVAPTRQRLTGQEDVAGTAAPVLVVLASRGVPGWAGMGGLVSASSWVEVSSKHTTGRSGS